MSSSLLTPSSRQKTRNRCCAILTATLATVTSVRGESTLYDIDFEDGAENTVPAQPFVAAGSTGATTLRTAEGSKVLRVTQSKTPRWPAEAEISAITLHADANLYSRHFPTLPAT